MQDSPDLRLIDLPRARPWNAEEQRAHAAIVKYLDAYGALNDGLLVA
jgi:hypothetical protein